MRTELLGNVPVVGVDGLLWNIMTWENRVLREYIYKVAARKNELRLMLFIDYLYLGKIVGIQLADYNDIV